MKKNKEILKNKKLMLIIIYIVFSVFLLLITIYLEKISTNFVIFNFKNKIKRIKIIETAEATRKKINEGKDEINISQINDIYLDITDENIKEIVIKKIEVLKGPKQGIIKAYIHSLENAKEYSENILNKENIVIKFLNDEKIKNESEKEKIRRINLRIENSNILKEQIKKDEIIEYNLNLLRDRKVDIANIKSKIQLEIIIKDKNNRSISANLIFEFPNSIVKDSINSYILDSTKIRYKVEKKS